MEDILQLDSVEQYNDLFGFETVNPLVTIVDFKDAKVRHDHARMNYGIYALFLKNGPGCRIKYGRKEYDYQEGTIVSFAPGQMVTIETDPNIPTPSATGLLFHPDLVHGTSLGRKMKQYHFFDYTEAESLHLSEQERDIVRDCFKKIQLEMSFPIDKHSRNLLNVNIELLLDYCLRFYDRQFSTREVVESDILTNFEANLDKFFNSGEQRKYGLPTVKYFADKAFLSPGYFGDLIRKETGKTAQEYIQNKIVNLSKEYLLSSNDGIGQIADALGFQYPQHFTRFFKKYVGSTPMQYRASV